MTPFIPDDYMTAREAADHLGMHLGSLAHQRSAGRSPMDFILVGRTVLYVRRSVEQYARQIGRAR